MNTATITATFNDRSVVLDLEDVDSENGMIDELWAMFRAELGEEEQPENDEEREDFPANLTFANPQGFAVHLFQRPRGSGGTGPFEPITAFDDVLKAWSDERDDDRRQAMADYLDNGNDDLDGFEDAYEGQYKDGAGFAQEHCEGCGVVPDEFPAWVCIDWEATWDRNLRHDYWISDNGHVFRN